MGKRKGRRIDAKRRKVGVADPFQWPRHSFFKIMVGSFRDTLKIPLEFSRSCGNLLGQIVHLEDADGVLWETKVSEMDNRWAFRQGWENFVLEHSITPGELLIFNYDGTSSFAVKIFGRGGCERRNFCEKRNAKRKKSASGSSLISRGNAQKPNGSEGTSYAANSSDVSWVIISEDDDEEEDIGQDRISISTFVHVQNEEKSPWKKRLKSAEEDNEPENMIVAKNGNKSEEILSACDTQMHENVHSEAPGENHSLTVDCTEGVYEAGKRQQDGLISDHDKNPSMTVDHVDVNEAGQRQQAKQDEPILVHGESSFLLVDHLEGVNNTGQLKQENLDALTLDFGWHALPRLVSNLESLGENTDGVSEVCQSQLEKQGESPSMTVDHKEGGNEAGQPQQENQDESTLDYGQSTIPSPISNLETLGVTKSCQLQQETHDESILDNGQCTLACPVLNLETLGKNPSTTTDHTEGANEAGEPQQEKQDESALDFRKRILPCLISNLENLGDNHSVPIDCTKGVNEAGQQQRDKHDELFFDYDQHILPCLVSNLEALDVNPSTTDGRTGGVNKTGQAKQEKENESTLDSGQHSLPCFISNFEALGECPSLTVNHTEGVIKAGESEQEKQEDSTSDNGKSPFIPVDNIEDTNDVSQSEPEKQDESIFDCEDVNNASLAQKDKQDGLSILDDSQRVFPCLMSNLEAPFEGDNKASQLQQEKQESILDYGNDPSPNNDYAEGINDTSQPEQEKQDEPIFDFGVEGDVRVDDSEKSKPVSEVVLKESESEITSKNESFLAKSPVFSFSIQVCSLACHELPVQIPRMGRKMSLNRKVVLLRDPAMKVWPVLYVEKSKSAQFLSGWEAFLAGNGLREGDTCHFQLAAAAPEHLFQVMISQGR